MRRRVNAADYAGSAAIRDRREADVFTPPVQTDDVIFGSGIGNDIRRVIEFSADRPCDIHRRRPVRVIQPIMLPC